jgi:hypothetical protein
MPITPTLHALLEALLAEAIASLEGRAFVTGKNAADLHRQREREAEIARQWIAGASAPISFDDVCWALGLDPAAIRDRVLPRFGTHLTGSPIPARHRCRHAAANARADECA